MSDPWNQPNMLFIGIGVACADSMRVMHTGAHWEWLAWRWSFGVEWAKHAGYVIILHDRTCDDRMRNHFTYDIWYHIELFYVTSRCSSYYSKYDRFKTLFDRFMYCHVQYLTSSFTLLNLWDHTQNWFPLDTPPRPPDPHIPFFYCGLTSWFVIKIS